MAYINRTHMINNHRTLRGTVSLLSTSAPNYNDLSTNDLRSAAAAYAASVPPNNQTINQQTNRPAKRTLMICTRYATRYATRATAAGGL